MNSRYAAVVGDEGSDTNGQYYITIITFLFERIKKP
jgi:hypothetical protein